MDASEAHQLRNEVAALHGVVAALNANVERLTDVVDRIHSIGARQEDHTGRISTLEKKLEQRLNWPTRIAFMYAGGMTALAGAWALLKAFGVLP